MRDHESEHGSQWSAIQSMAAKIGCLGETSRSWLRWSVSRSRCKREALQVFDFAEVVTSSASKIYDKTRT
jgi:hypothetical protein